MTFSFLTGLSIGLFLLPLAGATILAVAWQAPGVAVPLVNPDAGNALLFAGLIVGLGAIAAYSAALAKRA